MTPTDRRVDRQGELSEIEQFIAEKGVCRCKSAFVAPTSITVPDEKRRIAEMTLKPGLSRAERDRMWWDRLHRQATRNQSQTAGSRLMARGASGGSI